MTIAQVSREYGISADTLRYYEKIGLLRNVPRSPSGQRDYDEQACQSVAFLKCMRAAGVSIEALSTYIDLYAQGDATLEARKDLLIEQRKALETRLVGLQAALDRLNYKIEHYGRQLAPHGEPCGNGAQGCPHEAAR